MHTARLPLALALLGIALIGARPAAAAVIVIDGDDAQWQANPGWMDNDDPNGDAPNGWDIDKNWFHWGQTAAGGYSYYFMLQQTPEYLFPGNPAHTDRMYILLNTDRDLGTGPSQFGYQGVDYYIVSTPSNLSERTLANVGVYKWVWNGSNWITQIMGGTPTARGDNPSPQPYYWIQEFGLDPSLIGGPTNLWWGAYLDSDGAGQNPGDNCKDIDPKDPRNSWKDGIIPEPGTTALFGLGLLGIAAIRRRRTS